MHRRNAAGSPAVRFAPVTFRHEAERADAETYPLATIVSAYGGARHRPSLGTTFAPHRQSKISPQPSLRHSVSLLVRTYDPAWHFWHSDSPSGFTHPRRHCGHMENFSPFLLTRSYTQSGTCSSGFPSMLSCLKKGSSAS